VVVPFNGPVVQADRARSKPIAFLIDDSPFKREMSGLGEVERETVVAFPKIARADGTAGSDMLGATRG
jgi:hypothetical protein